MPISRFLNPILKVLREHAEPVSEGMVKKKIRSFLGISDEDIKTNKLIDYEIDYAKHCLSFSEFVSSPQRGIWQLTDKGKTTVFDSEEEAEDLCIQYFNNLKRHDLLIPIVQVMRKHDEPLQAKQVKEMVHFFLGVSDEYPKIIENINYEMGWAKQYLSSSEFVSSKKHENWQRGIWQLTDKGKTTVFDSKEEAEDLYRQYINSRRENEPRQPASQTAQNKTENSKPSSANRSSNLSPMNLILYGPPGTGKTYQLLETYLPQYKEGKRYEFVTFHPSYAYEDFVEGIMPGTTDKKITYDVKPGALKRICERARNDPTQDYALFIDEINRGNISKIFGEVISLIEKDKRIRTDKNGNRTRDCRGMEVTLPYAKDDKDTFGIPANLNIIGTMNTADRSIAILDIALRRRFDFEEVMPDPSHLGTISDGDNEINLEVLLKTINDRLTFLLHRDLTIGHSFFMGVDNFEKLKDVFTFKVLPLLQELFFDNREQIRLVLNDNKKDSKLQILQKKNSPFESIEGVTYDFCGKDNIEWDSIRKIYDEN